MNTIKINFCSFWGSFNKNENMFTEILSRYFNVEISENPDFVICSNRGDPFEYMKYDCVRIMIMGENISPDFTVFDYCIGFDYLTFGDRYFRLPNAFFNDRAKPWIPETLTREQAEKILLEKKYFCNFVYGHPSSLGMRELLFENLETYKPVISPGSYLNNTNTGKKRCSWQEKYEYLRTSKFTIASDSISHPGFVTEKIVQAFQHHSIPIYYGNPRINEDFNTDAFIWCKSKSDIPQVIEQVKYLDTNDDAYLEMLMSYPLNNKNYVADKYRELEDFLINIFSQSPENAFRRVRFFAAEKHEAYLKEYAKIYRKTPEFIRKIKR